MSRRAILRLPIALVIAAVMLAQIGGARAALCPTAGERAAPCRCCVKAKRAIEHDAQLRARCCAISSDEHAAARPEPVARRTDAPVAIAALPIAIAAAPVRAPIAAPVAIVPPRA